MIFSTPANCNTLLDLATGGRQNTWALKTISFDKKILYNSNQLNIKIFKLDDIK